MRIDLLIIDPQNDFCHKDGALSVPGATEDMERLAAFVERLGDKFYDIHVTLDTHHYLDVAHPIMWKDSNGKHPDPFTIITSKDLANGVWTATYPPYDEKLRKYIEGLEANGRYPLCIWPYHCLIGSWGYSVFEPLFKTLTDWEAKIFGFINYVTKGSNLWTEHYSAVQADVPDPDDPDTQLNMRLIDTLQNSDIILLAGEARSHCLANTVRDIADNFGEDNIKKLYLLEDATSDVPGFEDLGKQFVSDLTARGMQITSTVNFMK